MTTSLVILTWIGCMVQCALWNLIFQKLEEVLHRHREGTNAE